MGAKRLGGKRLGEKRLGSETTRGQNGLGAKRPGFSRVGHLVLLPVVNLHPFRHQKTITETINYLVDNCMQLRSSLGLSDDFRRHKSN